MKQRSFISPLQLFIVYINTAFGFGLLTLPRSAAEIAKQDMWMPVMICGFFVFLALWAAIRLAQCFPEQTNLEYNRILLGPILGQLVNLFQLSLLIMLASLSLASFSTAIKLFLFDLTPMQVFSGSILVVAVYATQYGYTPLLRLQQASFLIIYTLFIIVLLLGLLGIQMAAYKPMLAEGVMPLFKAAVPSWFSFSGPELITGLIFPYLLSQKSGVKTSAASVGFVTVIYTLTLIIVQGNLTPAATAHEVYPTIVAFRDIEIPDTFIERLDGYLMILWIIFYFNSLANLLFFASFSASRLLGLEYSRSLTVLLAPLLYYIAHSVSTINDYRSLFAVVNASSVISGLGLLPALLLIAWYKSKRKHAC